MHNKNCNLIAYIRNSVFDCLRLMCSHCTGVCFFQKLCNNFNFISFFENGAISSW